MKVGILTYHRAHNYGAYLQAYALCSRLNEEPDIDSEIIDFRMKKEIDFYSLYAKRRLMHPRGYIRNFLFEARIFYAFEEAMKDPRLKLSSERLVSDSLEEFQNFVSGKYDVIIAGSDEIWKVEAFRGFPSPYWLIGDLKCRKFSYAASSRSDFSKVDSKSLDRIVKNFFEFEYVGVREPVTAEALIGIGVEQNKVHVCCDPSFLYDMPVQKKPMVEILADKAKLDLSKKNIVVMTGNRELAAKIKVEFGKDYNLISVFDNNKGYINAPYLKPFEWLEVIKNADMVLTTYFHGTCFSIIYNTPFVSFGSIDRSSKIAPLFEGEENLKSRYVENTEVLLRSSDFRKVVCDNMKKYDATQYVKKRREEFKSFLTYLRK